MMFPKLSLLLGLAASANACNTSKSYKPEDCSSKEWQKDGRCRRIAEQMVQLQDRKSGGWPKCIYPIQEKEGDQQTPNDTRGTMDNGATVWEIRFLAHAFLKASSNRRTFRDAAKRGINFVLNAQHDTGGWPQYYPLSDGGSYQDAVTFNDGLHLNAMNLLKEIADSKPPFNKNPFVKKYKASAGNALKSGLKVILDAQIKDNERKDGSCPKKIGWCAQHDRYSLEPVAARDYEKASYSGKEGFDLAEYLMDQEPTEDIIDAVHGAWVFAKRYVIEGCEVVRLRDDGKVVDKCPDDEECDKVMRKCLDPDDEDECPDLWPRFADLKETKPIFCSRKCTEKEGLEWNDVPNGFNNVCGDRRIGYSWTGKAGEDFFKKYNEWKREYGISDPPKKCINRDGDALTCS